MCIRDRARHIDVEEDDSEFLAQEQTEGFLARTSFHKVLAEVAQNGFQREEILRSIIDQKDVDFWSFRLISSRSTAGRPGSRLADCLFVRGFKINSDDRVQHIRLSL